MSNGDGNMTDVELLGRFKGIVQTEIANLKSDVTEIKASMKSQDAKMDAYVKMMNSIVSDCRSDHRQEFIKMNNEIHDLNSFKDKVTGALIVISMAVTTAWGRLLRLI